MFFYIILNAKTLAVFTVILDINNSVEQIYADLHVIIIVLYEKDLDQFWKKKIGRSLEYILVNKNLT